MISDALGNTIFVPAKVHESSPYCVARIQILKVPDAAKPVFGGRVGKHPPELAELLDQMQLVYSIDPAAKW